MLFLPPVTPARTIAITDGTSTIKKGRMSAGKGKNAIAKVIGIVSAKKRNRE
jgi:hypothetical protein